MSRIGKYPVAIPQGVEVQIAGQDLKVKGKLGELSMRVHDEVSVATEDFEGAKVVRFKPRSESRIAKMVWPTMCRRTKNMMEGVSKGYTQNLEINGVGYRANMQGTNLVLSLGYSHEVRYPVPKGIKIAVNEQTEIVITGIDKEQIGQVAAEVRGFRPPEPYKGKGVKYAGEYIRRKEGKKK
jgi:large subunit ribosomal protein L6